MTFRQFLEQKEVSKPWVAKKADVLKLWNSVRTDSPLQVQPVPAQHTGKRFDQDGVRVTGSSPFINSVLARLKSFLFYADHPSLELDVKYRSVQRRSITDKPSFACYINVVQKK
jgi:hypothetical protein